METSAKLEKMFSAYAASKGLSTDTMDFLVDGTRINGDDTAMTLELKDNDIIDCALEQGGDMHWFNRWF
ncbi:hypothetical protein DVH05_010175 [Phytophthora capsici]|nr:hypothetical protein DVH05_010175 [Phytophthora capsici]